MRKVATVSIWFFGLSSLTHAASNAGVLSISGAMSGNGQIAMTMPKPVVRLPLSETQAGPTRSVVAFQTSLPEGSILVRTAERKLYYILPAGQAIAFRVGVGREGFAWSGVNAISRKAQWPDWRPPAEMIAREMNGGHIIPTFMPGGPKNPLGARALYIGQTDFRIHGTDKPWSIGHAASSGCIRMLNENVTELYDLVKVGAKVVVE